MSDFLNRQVPTPAQQCLINQNLTRPASRVMFCGRCGHAAGGSYGHWTSWCKLTQGLETGHFCCPGSCARVDGPEMDPLAPCHPAPGTYQEWARAIDGEAA